MTEKEYLNLSEIEEDIETNSVADSYDDLEKPQFKAYEDLKIIKSASAMYKVKNVDLSTEDIKKMGMDYGAYISDLRFTNSAYKSENKFTLKVPNQYFYELLADVKQTVEFVEYENVTTKDVTEEYVDINTRLKTKLEVKARYEEVLRKNAKTVEDILATEEKLRIIQEEIEAAQGRLKYLSNKVAYSTIQIHLYETIENIEEPKNFTKAFWVRAKEGLIFGWNFIENALIALIHLWPIFILTLLGLIIYKRRNRLPKP